MYNFDKELEYLVNTKKVCFGIVYTCSKGSTHVLKSTNKSIILLYIKRICTLPISYDKPNCLLRNTPSIDIDSCYFNVLVLYIEYLYILHNFCKKPKGMKRPKEKKKKT